MKKLLFFSILLIASCDPYSKRINSQEDKDRGQRIADKYYTYIKAGDFENAAALCGGEATPEQVKTVLTQMNGDMGAVTDFTLRDGNSDVTDSHHHTNGEIDLFYDVKYEKTEKTEDVILKFVNDSLKIAGYHTHAKKE
jgi:hypothetical protein